MRKTNQKGNVSVLRFKDIENYTMEDLLYVNSQHNAIDRLYRFLTLIYLWAKNKDHNKTAIQVVRDAQVDYHILSLLKKYNYVDDNCCWQLRTPPSKGDAVFLRIKLRKKRKSYNKKP